MSTTPAWARVSVRTPSMSSTVLLGLSQTLIASSVLSAASSMAPCKGLLLLPSSASSLPGRRNSSPIILTASSTSSPSLRASSATLAGLALLTPPATVRASRVALSWETRARLATRCSAITRSPARRSLAPSSKALMPRRLSKTPAATRPP